MLFPIRIAADAFGPGRPSQDLWVSPGHAICVDLVGEVLIPAVDLINGSTVAQIEMDEVAYWHVELESHDLLVANNLAAESYMDMGNRSAFAEAALEPAPEGFRPHKTHADFCRPFVADGPILEFARRRLAERAAALGWTPSSDVALRFSADGKVLRREDESGAAVFRFPAAAKEVRLSSDLFVPSLIGGADPRALGLRIRRLSLSSGEMAREIALDDPRIADAFHAEEATDGAAWRWTKGDLVLGSDFWTGFSGELALTVEHDSSAGRGWNRPPTRARGPALRVVA